MHRGTYSAAFKAKMLQKLLSPNAPSAYSLSTEANVAQSTLSRWRHEAVTIGDMSKKKTVTGRRKQWSVSERIRLVHEASQLSDEESSDEKSDKA